MSTDEQPTATDAAPRRPRHRRRGKGPGPGPDGQKAPEQTAEGPKTDVTQTRPSGSSQKRRRKRGRGRGGAPSDHQPVSSTPRQASGFLELDRGGNGTLRQDALTRRNDPKVPGKLVQELGLRPGDLVAGEAAGDVLTRVDSVNGHGLEGLAERRQFDRLTAVHPDHMIVLGPKDGDLTGRMLDLIAPVGRGQRGLIVAPPKAGKTTILKEIARGLSSDPELIQLALLIGERPEEVTELRREIKGMVLAADLDRPAKEHTRVAELGVEHAKRLAEEGRHVVILLDSLTRLARAYNLSGRGGGRTLSGGMDAEALQPVRQIFGAARTLEEGGSITIMATCLVDTGSKMDDVVYEEFKGTGNMEVHLDRSLAQKRLFPAINIDKTGTRREELLLDQEALIRTTAVRRKLAGAPADKALEALLGALKRQSSIE